MQVVVLPWPDIAAVDLLAVLTLNKPNELNITNADNRRNDGDAVAAVDGVAQRVSVLHS